MRLVGRFEGGVGTTARFAGDLMANLRFADSFFNERLKPLCDTFLERIGESLPAGEIEQFAHEPPEVPELDLAAEGISTVLWTSGYRPAFGWIELPIFDEYGMPRQQRGVTEIPGLTFIGLPWMYDMGSANLVGVARDAQHLARLWDSVSV
jgi:putative flavoprotein involved in K+ transport